MIKRLFVGALVLTVGLTCCCSSQCLVRDPSVYRVEMDFMEQSALQPVGALTQFLTEHCKCEGGQFTTEQCRKVADMILTVQIRVPWHKAMSLYLGGLEDKRPDKDPPVVPAPETLCPKGE